ncbi:MAG: hypothetical protein ABFS56_30410 [Pseudomonadota bacterium]
MKNISKYSDEFQALGLLRFENDAVKIEGQRGTKYHKYALLNEDQAVFVLTLSRNTPEVVQLKLDLTMAFKKTRAQGTQPEPQPSSFFPIPDPKLANELLVANAVADMLRMDDSSRLKMTLKLCQEYQLSTAFLPDYAQERPGKAITVLLKEHGSQLSAKTANNILIELGILEIQSRSSTSQGTKYFKCLTERGLEFGKNLVSPHNQRETQPHYYLDRFPELLDRINDYLSGATVMGGAA